MHEIITIQLGHFANFVGTHFWNTQESYFTYGDSGDLSTIDHNIHFRAGLGVGNEETFTPRTLIYDLKGLIAQSQNDLIKNISLIIVILVLGFIGGFGSLRKINQLYQAEDDLAKIRNLDLNASWNGKNETREIPRVKKNLFQESLDQGTEPERLTEATVQYWSDFNRLFYHPRSSIQVNEYEHANSLTPFDSFDLGSQLFETIDKEEDILDRQFRPFAEECDLMQGLQLLTSVDDAWGGFAAKYVDSLRDEYPKSIVWTWALERNEKTTREHVLAKTTASVQSLINILPSCTTYIPINLPRQSFRRPAYLRDFNIDSAWHVSALIASGIETCTLPTRLRAPESRRTMAEISMLLNNSGQQQISTLNLCSLKKTALADGDDPVSRDIFRDAIDFSWGGQDKHIFATHEVIRGHETSLKNSRSDATVKDPTERCYSNLLFPILSSFPEMFEEAKDGDTEGIRLATSLKTSASVSDHLKTSQSLVSRIVALDERETLSNGLGELWEAYQEGWDSDSDGFYD